MCVPPDPGWRGDPRRGASYGREGNGPATSSEPVKFYLRRVRLDSQGYDQGGAYWGIDKPLYHYESVDSSIDGWIRARDRDHAKLQIVGWFPAARFYR